METTRPIEETRPAMYTGLTASLTARKAQLEAIATERKAVKASLAKAEVVGCTTYLTNAVAAELTWLRALAAGKTVGYTMDKRCGHGLWRVVVAS